MSETLGARDAMDRMVAREKKQAEKTGQEFNRSQAKERARQAAIRADHRKERSK